MYRDPAKHRQRLKAEILQQETVWPAWLEVYEQRGGHAADADQLPLFEQPASGQEGGAA